MNLSKLFEIQRNLDDHIERKHPRQPGEERLAKKILALQIELGELANEWRGFKFWSKDQEPRTKVKKVCETCGGERYILISESFGFDKCSDCDGKGDFGETNPLLEEYVDGLHFFLSIGNDFSIDENTDFTPLSNHDVMTQIAILYKRISDFWWEVHDNTDDPIITYYFAFERYLGLSEALGFTWEQIEQAYLEKTKSIMNGRRTDIE